MSSLGDAEAIGEVLTEVAGVDEEQARALFGDPAVEPWVRISVVGRPRGRQDWTWCPGRGWK